MTVLHKKRNQHFILFGLVSLVLAFVIISPGKAVESDCSTSTSPTVAYTVTLCITAPTDGTTVSGDTTVTATLSTTGASPGVLELVFYLDSGYLLTDYVIAPTYTFQLPSTHFVDGTHSLSVQATMRDNFITSPIAINLIFSNGITQPPVNTKTFTPGAHSQPPAGQPFILAAVGDGASGEQPAVTNKIASWSPNMFLYLGDVYEKGSYAEFYNWYGTSSRYFGQFRSITNPVIGNHEYNFNAGAGYYDYWDNIPSYYSYNVAGWHFIALNSNSCCQLSQVPGSPQYEWLANDLANNTAACTLAYFHHPIYSVGPQGDTPRMNAMWALLEQYHADIVLTGHDHDYQRWKPLDANGNIDTQNGITSFIVGSGGHGIQLFVRPDDRMAQGFDSVPTAYGALKMLLYPSATTFQFINIAGTILDSGNIGCHNAPADTAPPSVPANFSASVDASNHPVLSWSASTDNVLVNGYTIYRDGQVLTTTNADTLSYTDLNVALGATYSYTVDAFDVSNNHSAQSNFASVTVPSQFTLVSNPVADTRVNASNPTGNYGNSPSIQADASPIVNTYARFNVQGVSAGQMVTSATLSFYANTGLTGGGLSIRSVADNSWGETSMTYNTAPAFGNVVSSLIPATFSAGTWLTADVTSLVSGNGLVSFAITSTNNTAIDLSSKEGANKPKLIINVGAATPPPPTIPPTIPPTVPPTVPPTIPPTIPPTVPPTIPPTVPPTIPPTTAVPVPTTPVSALTFNPVADTRVNASSPTTNYGNSPSIQADGSPVVNTYVRFNVQGVNGSVTSATLRFYANTGLNGGGLSIRGVADNSWSETSMTYNTAPAFGDVVSNLIPATFISGTWLTADVTSLVSGNGLVSFAITSVNFTAIDLSSKEGANKPQLVIQVGPALPTNTPVPTTPVPTTPVPTTPVPTTPVPTTPVPTTPVPTTPVPTTPVPTTPVPTTPVPTTPAPTTPVPTTPAPTTPAPTTPAPTTPVPTTPAPTTPVPTTPVPTTPVPTTPAPTTPVPTTPVPTTPVPTTPVPTTPVSGLTFNPVADTWVSASATTTNYGNSLSLQADASPVVFSYLRFNVQNVNGAVTNATLRVYANTALNGGLSVRSVADNTWGETTMTYSNAPAYGSTLYTPNPTSFSGGTWLSVDVTSLVSGNGLVSFAITSVNSTALSMSSKEGANKPQLVIQVGTPLPTSAATFTPTLSPTPLPTNTATFTPTLSPTPLPTNTATFTPTLSPTPLPTNTPTNTATVTLTPTAIPIPTNTPTNTPTFTPIPSNTPSG